MVVAALTLFALVLILAQVRQRTALAAWLAGLVLALYLLPGATKVAAPLAAIFGLGVAESLASLRPR